MALVARSATTPAFGARPLKRVIQREIGDRLATAILDGTIGEGDHGHRRRHRRDDCALTAKPQVRHTL